MNEPSCLKSTFQISEDEGPASEEGTNSSWHVCARLGAETSENSGWEEEVINGIQGQGQGNRR